MADGIGLARQPEESDEGTAFALATSDPGANPNGPSAAALGAQLGDSTAASIPAKRRPAIPNIKDDPLGAIGFIFQNVAAGFAGRPLPADTLRRQQQEDEELELRRVMLGINAMQSGLTLAERLPEGKREEFVKSYAEKFAKPLGPEFEKTFRSAMQRSDAKEVMAFFGEHQKEMAPLIARLGVDKALTLYANKEFRATLDEQSDATNRPIAAAKVETAARVIKSAVEAGQLDSTKAFPGAARDAEGNLLLSPDQLATLNNTLPKEFQLSPSELGTIRRNGYKATGLEVLSSSAAAKAAEERAKASAQGEKIVTKEIEDKDGNKFVVGLSERGGKEAWRIPAGLGKGADFQADDFKAGLALIAAGKKPEGIPAGAAKALKTIDSPEQAGQILEAMQAGGITLEQTPDGGTKLTIGGGKGSMTQSQKGQQEQNLQKSEIATRQALDLIGRMRAQLDEGKPLFAFIGEATQFIEGTTQQVLAASKAFGRDEKALIDPGKYDFGKLSEEAGKSAAFKANMTRLAYMNAKATDPGGRITKEDVQNELTQLGTAYGSPAQAKAALAQTEASLKRGFEIMHRVTRGGDVADDFWTQKQPGTATPASDAPALAPADPGARTVGTVYRNAAGKRAKWLGEGKWEPVD